jgi:hypothetical protein
MPVKIGTTSRELLAQAQANGRTNDARSQQMIEEARMARIFVSVRDLLMSDAGAGKLIVPLPPTLTNRNRNHFVQHRLKQHYYQQLGTLLIARLLPSPPDRPAAKARLEVRYFLHNEGDEDNNRARCKWPIDWMVSQGYLPGDKSSVLKIADVGAEVDRACQRLEFSIIDVS